jgi:hypothetical protein
MSDFASTATRCRGCSRFARLNEQELCRGCSPSPLCGCDRTEHEAHKSGCPYALVPGDSEAEIERAMERYRPSALRAAFGDSVYEGEAEAALAAVRGLATMVLTVVAFVAFVLAARAVMAL